MPVVSNPDIILRSRQGSPVLVAECRNARDLDTSTAQWMFDQYLTHYRKTYPFLLLASQDRGYLWGSKSGSTGEGAPIAEFSMEPVIKRYAPEVVADERLFESGLSFVIGQWLSDLTLGRLTDTEPDLALKQAGVLDLIDGASVRLDEAA